MKSGDNYGKGGRWCGPCNHSHGPLYACPNYPADVLAKVTADSDAMKANLRNPEWCAEQRRRGIPQFAIEIMGTFAGVRPGSGEPS